MFKNFFKLGKDSSGLNSISENFDVKQKPLSTCSVDNENCGNLMSGSVYTGRDLIICIIQRIDRFVIFILLDTYSLFGNYSH